MYPMTTYPHETHPDWSGCDTILKCPIGYFLARKKLSRLFPQSPLNSHPQRRIRRSHKKQYSNNGNVIHHEPNMAKSNFSSHGKYNSHGNWCQMMAINIQDKNCMCKMMRSRRRSRPRRSRKRRYGRTDNNRKNMKRIILKRGKITAIHDTTINCLEAQDIQQSSAKLLEFLAAKIHHQSPVIGRGTVGRGVFWQSFDHNSIKSWTRIMEIGLGSSHCPPWQAVQLAEFLENFCPPMFTPHEGNWGKMRKNGGKWGKSLSWPNHLKKSCQLHRWFFVAIGRGQSNFHDSIPWSEWEIHR